MLRRCHLGRLAAFRLSSGFLVLVCLLGQLAGSVHTATVRHVACGEHGGVVELGGADSAASAPGQLDARPQHGHATVYGAGEAHHEHCERCATPSVRSGAAPPHLVASSVSISRCARVVQGATPPPIALIRLAPKGSPPGGRIAV